MDDYYTHLRGGQNFMRRDLEVINPTGHATDLFAEWACQYLTERNQINQQHAQQVPQPFFLYLAFNAPHDPIQPPQEWVDRVVRREPGITTARAKLVALIEHMDAGIGRVLDTLDRLQMSNQTLVFFTSDNGGLLGKGANNGPWRSEKQHMYEGGLRVPAIARWPGQFPPGQRTSLAATTMDLFPTIAEAAKVTSPSTIDGLSFLSAIAAIPDPSTVRQFQNRDLYFVRREGGAAYGGKTIEALIRGNWKLIQDSPFQPLELYNLAIDPIESENLVSTEKEQFQTLSAALRKRIQDGGKTAWQPPSNKE